MKLKIDKRHLTKLRVNITEKAKKALGKNTVAKRIRDKYVKDIREKSLNTKTGRSYKALKPSTIEHRRYLAKNNTTHPDYRPSKPNMTLTGELLDAVEAGLKRDQKGKVTFTLGLKNGKHKKYRSSKNKPIGKTRSSYADIEKGLRDMGRPLFLINKRYFNKNILPILEKHLRKIYK